MDLIFHGLGFLCGVGEKIGFNSQLNNPQVIYELIKLFHRQSASDGIQDVVRILNAELGNHDVGFIIPHRLNRDQPAQPGVDFVLVFFHARHSLSW